MQKTSLALFLIAVFFALTVGCDSGYQSGYTPSSQSPSDSEVIKKLMAIGDPSDYFPTKTGMRWEYDIEIFPPHDGLTSEEVDWPLGNEFMVYKNVGRLYSSSEDEKSAKKKRLILSVIGPAPKQGPLEYPLSVELKVEADDMNIFDCDRLFWAITNSGRYSVDQVATYSPTSIHAPSTGGWGGWVGGEGFSMRTFFFGAMPGTGIGLHDSGESTFFIGPENKDGKQCLHFQRMVDGVEDKKNDSARVKQDDAGELGKAFTEDMFFAKDVGLILLEQRVGGELSMRWKKTN